MYFMRTNNADFYDAHGKAHFNTPETIETVRFLTDLVQETGPHALINYSEDDAIDNFAKGSAGFILCAGTLHEDLVSGSPGAPGNSSPHRSRNTLPLGTKGRRAPAGIR